MFSPPVQRVVGEHNVVSELESLLPVWTRTFDSNCAMGRAGVAALSKEHLSKANSTAVYCKSCSVLANTLIFRFASFSC